MHYQTHFKTRKFCCETCMKSFSLKGGLKQHQLQHQHGIFSTKPAARFECNICNGSFATAVGFTRHKRDVHSQRSFHCDICGKTFKCKSSIGRHMQIHSQTPCPICQFVVARSRLKDHIAQHSSEFTCKVCEKDFSSQKLLTQHIHMKVPCSICGKPIFKLFLKQHMKYVHSSGKQFLICNVKTCPRRFLNAKELAKHQEIHIETRYKCPKCNYEVKNLQHVKRHLRSH